MNIHRFVVANRDIIVVGASSGGIEALRELVRALPPDLPATVFIVLHIASNSPGILHNILERAGKLPVLSPNDRQRFQPGQIYVAPPDKHLLIEPGSICLSRGPKENRFRPAIDPLFRSAAQVYGPRVIGVILTGNLDDGTGGLWTIKQLGGTTVVQDPADALFPSMPTNALRYVRVDYCLPLTDIAPQLVRLTNSPLAEEGSYEMPENLDIEVKIAKADPAIDYDVRNIWEKSSYTCPECHGVLLQLEESGRARFRCHTGHAYSADSLLADLTEDVENSLWDSIRTMEESVMLMRHLAEHARGTDPLAAKKLFEKAEEAEGRSGLVRKATLEHEELNIERVVEEVTTTT